MTTTRTIKRLKQDGSYLKKENNIALNQALNLVAKQHGYENWQDLAGSAIDGKVAITTSDSEAEESQEKTLNQQNRALLAEYGIEPPRLYRRLIYLSQAAMPDRIKLS